MRTLLITVAWLGLTAACTSQSRAPPAASALLTARERAMVETLPLRSRELILRDARAADACLRKFQAMDGSRDGAVEARRAAPRFLTGWSEGVARYAIVPGVERCAATPGSHFTSVPEAVLGPQGADLAIRQACGEAALTYATAFNRTLAQLKPDLLHDVCPHAGPAG